jgi:secreted trypsin-like serine protease
MKQITTILALIGISLSFTACSPSAIQVQNQGRIDYSGSTDGIIGGVAVNAADPISQSTVLLIDTQIGALCTGSLISTNLVLTAAHCTNVNPKNIIVVFSTTVPHSAADLTKMTFRRVVGGKTSDLWPQLTSTQTKNWGDIAILKFEGSLANGYKPATLASRIGSVRTGSNVVLAGFGLIDGVQKTRATELRKTSVVVADGNYSQSEFLMDQHQGRGACHGDSGGPAYLSVGSSNIIVGITSRGTQDPKDTCNGFSVYTSVAAHAAWISATSRELQVAGAGTIIPQPK